MFTQKDCLLQSRNFFFQQDVPITKGGYIPAHLLGNMWAQQWEIEEIVKPFNDTVILDVSDAMVEQVGDFDYLKTKGMTSFGIVKP